MGWGGAVACGRARQGGRGLIGAAIAVLVLVLAVLGATAADAEGGGATPAETPEIFLDSDPPDGSTISFGTVLQLDASVHVFGEVVLTDGLVRYFEDNAPIGEAEAGTALHHSPGVGTHTYTAVYLGLPDVWDPSALSDPITITVERARAAVTLHPTRRSGTPGPVTLLADVVPVGAGALPAPGGLVRYVETTAGPNTSGAAVTAAVSGTRPVGTPFVTSLGAGGHTFVAQYMGDGAFVPASSQPVTVTLSVPPGGAAPPELGDVAVLPAVAGSGSSGGSSDVDGPPGDTEEPDEPSVDDDSGDQGSADDIGDGVEAAAGPTSGSGDADSSPGGAHRSDLVEAVPDPSDISWSPGHVAANLLLTLLLIMLVALPAELINSTLEEHYERVNRPLRGVQTWLAAVEEALKSVPNGVLVVVFAAFGALVAGQLDPHFGFNATSAVLFAALMLAFVAITGLLELARVPFLNRRAGQKQEHHVRLYPLVLILGVAFVALSRVVDFQPGYVFGITCGLLLAEEVDEDEEARSLAFAGGLLLLAAVVAWLLWLPFVDTVQGSSPGLGALFADAFLATLWMSCLQAVLFGYAPLEALDGKIVQRWSFAAWALLCGTATFLLLQFLLHPSAGRWGGVSSTTFFQMLGLFLVFLVGSVVFWAWFQFRGDPVPRGRAAMVGADGDRY